MATGEDVAIKLEPIKAHHPQLMYEYKLYKILQGGSKCAAWPGVFRRLFMSSWCAVRALVWHRRRLQRDGDGPAWAVAGGLVQFLWPQTLSQNSSHARGSIGKREISI